MNFNQRGLTEIVNRTNEGFIGAYEATEMAAKYGYLAIGTAVSSDVHIPGIPLTSIVSRDSEPGSWQLMIGDNSGQNGALLRATDDNNAAIWAAFGGSANVPLQRFVAGLQLTPRGLFYSKGTHGWWYDQDGAFKPIAHTDLITNTRSLPDDYIIGKVDFVKHDDSFAVPVPREPRHFATPNPQETMASAVVRMSDVRSVLMRGVTTYNYPAISM